MKFDKKKNNKFSRDRNNKDDKFNKGDKFNKFQKGGKFQKPQKKEEDFYALTNEEQKHINELNTRYRDRAKERLENNLDDEIQLPKFDENEIFKDQQGVQKAIDINSLKQEIQQIKQEQQKEKIERPQQKIKSLLAKNIMNVLQDTIISCPVKQNAYYDFDISTNINDCVPNIISKRLDQNVRIVNSINEKSIKHIDIFYERLSQNYYQKKEIEISDNDDIFADAPKQENLQENKFLLGKRKLSEEPEKIEIQEEEKIIKKSKLEILQEFKDDGYGECYPEVNVGLDVMKEERNYQGKKTFAEAFFTESNSQRRAYKPKQVNWSNEMNKIEKVISQRKQNK